MTEDGETGTVFWCYREDDFWRVHFTLDDGRNESALSHELSISDTPLPGGELEVPVEENDCMRCASYPAEYDTPDLLCERCWKEWLYADWAN